MLSAFESGLQTGLKQRSRGRQLIHLVFLGLTATPSYEHMLITIIAHRNPGATYLWRNSEMLPMPVEELDGLLRDLVAFLVGYYDVV